MKRDRAYESSLEAICARAFGREGDGAAVSAMRYASASAHSLCSLAEPRAVPDMRAMLAGRRCYGYCNTRRRNCSGLINITIERERLTEAATLARRSLG